MSNLATLVGQILDKASDVVKGPVQGLVNATTTSGIVPLRQGQLGTLPDGRIVRVMKETKVSSSPTPVPVRLLQLAPAFPVANNFAAVPASTVVTWQSPPAGVNATGGAVADFAPKADALLTSLAEHDELKDPETDAFAAGANGTALGIMLSPQGRVIAGSDHLGRMQRWQVTWTFRVNLSSVAGAQNRRTKSRDACDALQAALQGAKVGDGPALLSEWKRTRVTAQATSWEMTLTSQHSTRGRTQQSGYVATLAAFTHLDAAVHVNPNGQSPEIVVDAGIDIPSP